MAVTKIKPIKGTLNKALDYIQNPEKTDGKMLVSSFGCSYETADIEFAFTLSQALDKGSNLAHHLIQAFEPGEVDYQTAHEIGRQLADAVTKGQHEYVLTTHIDKGHIHNHIIFCAVNFVDHHKYNSNKRSYYGIRNMSDKLCREHGLSVVLPNRGSKGKSYAEYQAEKTGTSWKGKLKIAVDALIPQVSSFEELLSKLQAAGYEIKQGKYISCRAPGQERFTRLKTLGADYTEEAIRERISGKRARFLIGAAFEMLRSRTAILGVKVSILYLFVFVSEKPCNQRLFSPLLRNKSTLFSHALGCLSAGNPLPTVRAVFDAVRGGRKERATHGTFLSVLGLIEFRIEQLIKRKYGNPKPLTEQGIGNELRAYASVPVVQ